MATEVSIAKQLSGTECLEACLEELRKVLSLDGRFHSHKAYQGFRAEIHFKFTPASGFVPGIDRELLIENGDLTDIEDSPTVDEKAVLPMRPPNQVREEAGMPTPVLVTDGQGRSTEKWVKKGDKPKNTYRGGKTK
jgi:hypothetical protein